MATKKVLRSPVLATAHAGTQVAEVVGTCCKVVVPSDEGLVQGLLELLRRPQERKMLGVAARKVAIELDKSIVLGRFESQLLACLLSSQSQ